MIAISETAVRAMLDAYAQAWGQFDIEAIAEHVALPCVVERDHRRTFIEDDAALMEALAAEVAAYRDAGGAIASVESIGPLVDLGDGRAVRGSPRVACASACIACARLSLPGGSGAATSTSSAPRSAARSRLRARARAAPISREVAGRLGHSPG